MVESPLSDSEKRIGILLPSSNTTMEKEFSEIQMRMNVSFHYSRLRLQDVTEEALIQMEEDTEKESQKLADAHVEFILYGCTSGSLIKGLDYSKKISERITGIAHVPAVTTSEAVLSACQKLDLDSMSILTPYTDHINQREKDFFESQKKRVTAIQGYHITDNTEIGLYSPDKTCQKAIDFFRKNPSEGLFISCTNLLTMEILPSLEKKLCVPVFSSNAASLFSILNELQLLSKSINAGLPDITLFTN